VRKLICLLVILGLMMVVFGCDSKVNEPGEPEHGGVFLHGNPDNNAATH
jgi:hypothetical protein